MNLPTEFIEKLQAYAYFGTLGAFAALVGYLYQVARVESSKISLLLIFATVIIGFYLGVLFAGVVPKDWENRDAVVLLVGATGLKGFEIVTGWAKSILPKLLQALVPPGKNGEG